MPEYIGGGQGAFYQPAGYQQGDIPSGAESEYGVIPALLQRRPAYGNRRTSLPPGGKRVSGNQPGRGTASQSTGAGNGAFIHRREHHTVQICTATLSEPVYT